MNHIFDDRRDDELARALADALPTPPADDVDWSALHARITVQARPLLQRAPAVAKSWWQPMAHWSRAGIPLAAAASVLLVLGTARIGAGPTDTAGADTAPGFVMIEEALVDGVAGEARPLLAGIEAADMVDVALFYEGEDW
jgi:hypothetical protein